MQRRNMKTKHDKDIHVPTKKGSTMTTPEKDEQARYEEIVKIGKRAKKAATKFLKNNPMLKQKTKKIARIIVNLIVIGVISAASYTSYLLVGPIGLWFPGGMFLTAIFLIWITSIAEY